MKVQGAFRFVVLAAAVAVLLGWSARLAAADATGGSPADGIPVVSASTEICSSVTVPAGGQIWLKVQYHADTDLEMYSEGADGLWFGVYDPTQVANWPTLPAHPTGLLTPNSHEPNHTSTWQGHLAQGLVSDYYYVLVSNPTQASITFSFCTIETAKFIPPSPNVMPTPCFLTDGQAGDGLTQLEPCFSAFPPD